MASDATLRRRARLDTLEKKGSTTSQDKSSPPPLPKPTKVTIYSVLSQSQPKFTLVKSRELKIPLQIGAGGGGGGDKGSLASRAVVSASLSLDDSLIAVWLTNGRLWVFSLDEIAWVTCIASAVSMMMDPVFAAPTCTRTPRPRFDCSPLDVVSVSLLLPYKRFLNLKVLTFAEAEFRI